MQVKKKVFTAGNSGYIKTFSFLINFLVNHASVDSPNIAPFFRVPFWELAGAFGERLCGFANESAIKLIFQKLIVLTDNNS